jgi:signal transduction histidine kinase
MGDAVRETVDRCERLIEGLLMLARSEAAAGRDAPVDIAALAADCITDLRVSAERAGVTVEDDLEPAWARGEPALLERMIANLIDNGIRHNEPGGRLRIRTRARGGRVELVVANGGTVIAPADAETLTEPFRRLARGNGGFGLGLSIVRSVVNAHSGRLEIEAPASGGLEVRIGLEGAPPGYSVVAGQSSAALTRS